MNWADHILMLYRMSGLRRFRFSQGVTVHYWHNSTDDMGGTVHYWTVMGFGFRGARHFAHMDLVLLLVEHPDLELLGVHLS